MLKIGFHGDTFAAREHNTNGMFHFFFTKIWCKTNVGLLTDLVVNVIKRTCITKASLKSVNFTLFLGQTSFFVIFLCYRVKRFLAIPVAMVTIIRNFKKTIILCLYCRCILCKICLKLFIFCRAGRR